MVDGREMEHQAYHLMCVDAALLTVAGLRGKLSGCQLTACDINEVDLQLLIEPNWKCHPGELCYHLIALQMCIVWALGILVETKSWTVIPLHLIEPQINKTLLVLSLWGYRFKMLSQKFEMSLVFLWTAWNHIGHNKLKQYKFGLYLMCYKVTM